MISSAVCELVAAVAARRAEDVAGQALRVHAHQHRLGRAHLAHHQRHVVLAVDQALEGVDAEVPVRGGQVGLGDLAHQPLRLHAVADQVADRDHADAVLAAERLELRRARHRPVLVHDLADDAGRVEAGEPRQVDRGLGLAGAREDAAGLRAQREHVARPGEVPGLGRRVDRREHGARPVGGRDAGGDALARLDRHAEGGPEAGVVLLVAHHQRDAQLVEPLAGHRQADEAAPVARHEVDRLGRDLLGGDRQVALVLAVLVVDDDEHAAGADVLEGLGNRGRHRRETLRLQCPRAASSRSTYLAITSASRLTRLPGLASRRLVTWRV